MKLLKYLNPEYWRFKKLAQSRIHQALSRLRLRHEENRIYFPDFEKAYQFILATGDYLHVSRVDPIGQEVFVEYILREKRPLQEGNSVFLLNLLGDVRELFQSKLDWVMNEDDHTRTLSMRKEGYEFIVDQAIQRLSLTKRYDTGRYIYLNSIGFFHQEYGHHRLTVNFDKPVSEQIGPSGLRALIAVAYHFLRLKK